MWADCSGVKTPPASRPTAFTSLSDGGLSLFQAKCLSGFSSTLDCCEDTFVFAERSGLNGVNLWALLSVKCGKWNHW